MAGYLGKPSQGQLFEQSIFQNIRSDYKLSFYNKAGATEIDFIVDKKVALEVKVAASARDITTLKMRAQSIQLSESYVVASEYCDKQDVIVVTDL
jgi:predicted AAA+ superfamily ATPase